MGFLWGFLGDSLGALSTDTQTHLDVCISRAPFGAKNKDFHINLSAAVNILFKNTLTQIGATLQFELEHNRSQGRTILIFSART